MNNNSHSASRDPRMATAEWQVSMDLDRNVLDELPESCMTVPSSPRLPAMFDERSIGAEKLRVLASRLQYLRKQRPLKTIVVTSTVKGEGKSVISANLAITLGRRHKTLLIDGDLRQSGLAILFNSHERPGLADWWRESSTTIMPFLLRVGALTLWHLPAGQAPSHPLEILQSQRTADMLNMVSEFFDWVIIDAPPLVPVADPNLWATQADGTLLVVKQGETPKRLLRKSLDSIENLKLVGIVMNGSRDAVHQYYGQYYKRLPRTVAASAPKGDPAMKGQI
jgi:capsular exopolysaccharide synthesis family protein